MKNEITQEDLQGLPLERPKDANPTPEVDRAIWLAIYIVLCAIVATTAIRCHAGKQVREAAQTASPIPEAAR